MEPPASLLVHLGPQCHSIQAKEEHLLRPNHVKQEGRGNMDGISFDCIQT